MGEPRRRADRKGRLAIGLPWVRSVFAALLISTGLVSATAEAADYPWAKRVAAAERFADGRAGRVSFAVVDEAGRLRGDHLDRVHNSASVVKVMLMVALLREPDVRHDALTATEKHLLGPMVRRSDNQAASTIYARVGEGALHHLARDAGMRHFSTQPLWGLTTITAAGQARFLYRLERFIPRRHRGYAMHLLTQIVAAQRWGMPSVAPRGWKLHFKGGWSGAPSWRVNQVMLLRDPPRRFSLAILTREQPSLGYGTRTIEGVARRLLRRYNRLSRATSSARIRAVAPQIRWPSTT